MPPVTCPHCGEQTFSISGWVDLDHCAHCGKPLGPLDQHSKARLSPTAINAAKDRVQGPMWTTRQRPAMTRSRTPDHVMTTTDGVELAIRPIAASDRAALIRSFEHLSTESRYRRFLAPVKRLTESDLTSFTELDHRDREALISLTPDGQIVGVARYIRLATGSDKAEVAVTVADEWQHRGVGTALLERLAKRARASGIDSFIAVCLTRNRDMLQLLRELGPLKTCEKPDDAGVIEAEVELPASTEATTPAPRVSASAAPRPAVRRRARR
jgi:GNAT superfamily N-acetyltransferase